MILKIIWFIWCKFLEAIDPVHKLLKKNNRVLGTHIESRKFTIKLKHSWEMNYSLYLTLFILGSGSFCSSQSVLDTLKNLSEKCQHLINDRLVVCKNTVDEKWFINETSAKNFAPEMKRKVTCCSNWDFITCIEKSIVVYFEKFNYAW